MFANRHFRPAAPIILAAALAANAIASSQPQPTHAQPTHADSTTAEPAPLSRADLVIPDHLYDQILAGLDLPPHQPLGYSADQLANFGRDRHLLQPVLRQFHDLRHTIRFSGKATDLLLDNAAHPDEFVRHAFYQFLDEAPGRRIRLPGLDSNGISGELPHAFDPAAESAAWSVDWLKDETGADLALDAALSRVLARFAKRPGDDERQQALHAEIRALAAAGFPDEPGLREGAKRTAHLRDRFDSDDLIDLPDPAKRLIVRLLVALAEAEPWVHNAVDRDALDAAAFRAADSSARPGSAYQRAVAVRAWDESAPLDRAAFDLVGSTDLAFMGYAAVLTTKRIRLALDEFNRTMTDDMRASPALARLDLSFITPNRGRILLAGAADHQHRSHHHDAPLLTLDFAGDDTYTGAFAVSDPLHDRPVSILIDLEGDDTYTHDDDTNPAWKPAEPDNLESETRRHPTLAAGVFGLGLAYDLGAGDDAYHAHESSLGAAWHGVGLLIDDAGDDSYTIDTSWGQGSAHVGLGALIDLAGDDAYTAAQRSQAHGSTRGAGLLVDLTGDDAYLIRDDGAPSALYLGRTVAMGQGVGYGRRADLWDSKSMAGGFGVLVDGAGDDSYSAMAWSQGAAYWWGVGILEDRAGNDTYRQGKYSQGAAAHFGVGVFVDLQGDDRYNTSRERMTDSFRNVEQWVAENQYAGHARDGGLAICIDAHGDDVHTLRANSAGNADLNSIALFWDRAGDDQYLGIDIEPNPDNPNWVRQPLGTVTHYPDPTRSFRDDMLTLGVFLDTHGRDTYHPSLARPQAANDRTWSDRQSLTERAVAIDNNAAAYKTDESNTAPSN